MAYSGLLNSKSSIESRRRLAEALLGNVANRGPAYGGKWEGVARALEGVGAGLMMRNANNQDSENRSKIAQALQGGATPEEMETMALESGYDELLPLAGNRRQSQFRQEDIDWRNSRAEKEDSQWGQQFGLEREKFDWQKNAPPDPTDDMREYEMYSNQAVQAGQEPMSFFDYQQGLKKAGATSISNTVDAGGRHLDKKLDEKEGEAWSGYLDAADVSGGAMQDMQALDELLKIAPQGPITGRAAEMFPGFSSAGDAVIATTKRIAPTLRTPGSGSTSDIEYQGMLQSVPRLSASPGGNQIILNMMKAKAQINMQRGEIVAAYQNGQIDAATARSQIRELNRRSIMTPEMKAIISQNTGMGGEDINPLLDKYAPQ